ncbi:class I SAM-dependent methyltransferase [Patescibacteria group bacterium]|nr:class I SAM-dependent methyltransferase [Patescibacteria group bacterium]
MILKFPSKFKDWDITIALRYLPVVSFLEREKAKKDSILEIGSGSFGICPYLREKVTGVDIVFDKKTHRLLNPVRSKAEKLPFKDNAFHFVLSIDALEHLSARKRKLAIKEMFRVSRKGVIIGTPSGFWASLADKFLDWYYSRTHKDKLAFLTEHLSYGLPKKKELEKWLVDELSVRNKKAEIKIHNNTNVFLLISLLILGFSENKFLCRLYRYTLFLIPILRFFNFSPAYRKLFFVRIQKDE